MTDSVSVRVRADFNGLFGELLCLSHKDTCEDEAGNLVAVHSGMTVIKTAKVSRSPIDALVGSPSK